MKRILSMLAISFFAATPFDSKADTQTDTRACQVATQDKAGKPKRPVDVFAKFDGKWRGTFVVYDSTGEEQHRIQVEQEYATIDAHTQTVTIRDRMADGKIITGRGANTARVGKDGALVLKCSVKKSNGERSVHDGRIVTGPTGRSQLVWYSRSKGKTETFREWVEAREKRTTYHIHGLGKYGDTVLLMAGDYSKVVK
jgi:hypothetical protein